MSDFLSRATEIADTVLFPATLEVERAGRIPASHLELLADEGFYAMAAPPEFGGPDVDFRTACALVETLASGCLSTTFVWTQHHGVVLRVAFGQSDRLREEWLTPLCRGQRRAGVALGGTLPGTPKLVAHRTSAGYVLNGQSPWVTGWGLIDVVAVAARDRDDLIWLLVDAEESSTLTVERQDLVAVNASSTVTARFAEHVAPADRLITIQPYADWARADAGGLRLNGSLALGLTRRCTRLLGESALDADLKACRDNLDAADTQTLPEARAAATELAMRAATTLVAQTGSQAILAGQHAQKLAREALFLLVFASRPKIKSALVRRLSRVGEPD
ncbi:MAG TPA: acyl-CoA dehydrogenase family protein [Pseudonocardiaceae bacterium]|jgi:alkylation response protein AidB-like acyl-CoA dehydrogenase|nr:acyl-CoA dehydrogenase family protein [Pseudonocardiaceae bacterium]